MNPRLFLLCTVLLLTGVSALRAQDEEQELRRQQQVERAAQQRAEREAREDKKLQDWLERGRQQSESNLNLAIRAAREAKTRENEVKFARMEYAVSELFAVSQRLHEQVQSSGAHAISPGVFMDLDRIEKLAKEIRAAAK